jgi:hypothetical protein
MPGGLLQLTVIGKQNEYLSGKPSMTYFKYGYCQHTNFATEAISQSFDGNIDFGKKVTATISRNGDLVNDMILQINLPRLNVLSDKKDNGDNYKVNWVNCIGYRMIEYISLEIGGTEIDRHSGEWLYLNSELSLTDTQKRINNTITHNKLFQVFETSKDIQCYIPLKFWFCKEIGAAIPLVALQYHEIKVHIKFKSFHDCIIVEKEINIDTGLITKTQEKPKHQRIINAQLLCNYIFLDKTERKWFSKNTHKYLIEQVQYNGVDSISSNEYKLHLDFNHPCKELIWYATLTQNNQTNDWLNFSKITNYGNTYGSSPNSEIIEKATLFLNGHERMEERDSGYFRLTNVLQFHSGCPNNYIYSYPLSLFPEKLQPSGVLNFSVLDEAFLLFKYNKNHTIPEHNIHVYSKNYNILVISQGMGGLSFHN